MKSVTLKWHMAAIILLLLALVVQDQSMNDAKAHDPYQKVHSLLEQGVRLDAESELNMLTLLNHQAYNYDELTQSAAGLHRWLKDTQALLQGVPEVRETLSDVAISVGVQLRAIEDFKADIGIWSNSERYLPTLVAQLVKANPEQSVLLMQLVQHVYQWSAQTDNQALLSTIHHEQSLLKDYPVLNQHIDVVLDYRERVQNHIVEATTCGTPENTYIISRIVDEKHAQGMKKQQQYEYVLQFLFVVLLAYLLFLIVRLFRLMQKQADDQRELVRLKEALEVKVSALSSAENRFRTLFDVIPDAVVVHQHGLCLFANPAAMQMYGYDQVHSFVGQSVIQHIHEDDRETVAARIKQTEAGDSLPLLLEKHVKRDGSVFFVEVQGVCFKEGQDKTWVAIVRDITQRLEKEAEQARLKEALEHSQRLESLGVLAGGIAHDFNNLLSAIMGNVELLKMNVPQEEKNKKFIANTLNASQRAADLCQQMLAYSGRGQFVLQDVQISEMIRDMVELLKVSMKKSVYIHYELQDDVPMVEVDRAQIQQVVLNLMTNANEAMEKGEITCRTGVCHLNDKQLQGMLTDDKVSEGDFVFVEVADQGCGMDADTMQKIFDPFFTTKFTGRGLGMSAVLGIVRGHHGALDVQSELGQGTVFRLYLPIRPHQHVAVHQGIPVETSAKKACSGTVLVVDDEDMILEVATAMLEDMGLNVLQAKDGLQALAVYQQHAEAIDVVLLDMTMPKMDGKSCFYALQKMNKHVKVIISSGYHAGEIHAKFTENPSASVVQKPYNYDQLEQALTPFLPCEDDA